VCDCFISILFGSEGNKNTKFIALERCINSIEMKQIIWNTRKLKNNSEKYNLLSINLVDRNRLN